MRSLDNLPIDFILKDKRFSGGSDPVRVDNIKKKVGKTWRHSTRGRGGWWVATALWDGPAREKEEFFTDGLQREIDVVLGSELVWRGFIGKMILTRPNGERFIRDWSQVYNKWKSIYTRVGDNVLTNGSAESGAWAALGTPATLEMSTDWSPDGDYSCHIVTGEADEGAIIQTNISVLAGKGYQAKVAVKIVSGDWFFEIYRMDNGDVLAQAAEGDTGEFVLNTSLSDQNTYSGLVGLRLRCDDAASREIYGDGAVFQDAPYRAESSWYSDTTSQSEYGIKEEIILLGGSSDNSAAVKAQSGLARMAWARSLPPDSFGGGSQTGETKLEIFVLGYVWTANNTHCLTTGTDAASDQVEALVAECEFLSAGVIESNTHNYQIETQSPIRIWDVLEDITLDGDASGDLWECGVYHNNKLNYVEVDETVKYTWQDGQLKEDKIPLDPWLARPGFVRLDDMPLGSESVRGYEVDDPRVVYMFEVEFNAADWLDGLPGISWIRDRSHE